METSQNNLDAYKEELITILHKSQDAFEKQLSYISAGALALSIGFIKDVVKLDIACHKGFLIFGWILLILTLLVNFISHNISAHYLDKTIGDINNGIYDDNLVRSRFSVVKKINWFTIGTLVAGIFLIILFISLNIKK